MPKWLKFVIEQWVLFMVRQQSANVAGMAIQNFRIGPSLSNRIGTSDLNSNRILKFRKSLRFTNISGHPSAVGRAQDSESSSVKDQRSATEPRN